MIEEIIRPREHELEEEEEIIEFPNLKYMYLDSLPRLKNFYCKKINTCSATPDQNTSTFPVHSLFNGMVSFPVLEELRISRIENVMEIWEPQCHIKNSFSQLKILDVQHCDKLENVIPFAMLGRLQNTETLKVKDCISLKCIVDGAKTTMTEDQEGSDSEIAFPVLKTLALERLPKLDNFWCTRSMGSTIDQHQLYLLQKVSFPRLENLCVHGCNLSTLFTCFLAKTNLQQLEWLSIQWCEKLEEIVSDENEGNKKMVATGTNAHAADDETILIVFPRLKTIVLEDLPVLKSFCGSARYTFNMPSLEEVYLVNCPRMINFTCRQLTTPKFTITGRGSIECTDLNKYLQTLRGAEGELEMANNSDGNQDNSEDDDSAEDDAEDDDKTEIN